MIRQNLIIGLDIGNGYIKGHATQGLLQQPFNIDLPSVVVMDTVEPKARIGTMDINKSYMDNLCNELSCKFSSTAILNPSKHRNICFMGANALALNASSITFDIIDDNSSKAEQNLSSFLILGNIASSALSDFYNRHNKLVNPPRGTGASC